MSQSHELRVILGDDDSDSIDTGGTAILIAARNCNLSGSQGFGIDQGKRGTRQIHDCGARLLSENVAGGFDFYPTAAELDWIIERMIGDNISSYPSSAATPAETLPRLIGYVDKGADIFKYLKLYINSVTITASEGDYVNVRVDFIGSQEVNGQTWPSGSGIPTSYSCASKFITPDVTVSYNSTAYPFKSFALAISNNFVDGQHENSLTRTIFEAGRLTTNFDGTFGWRTDTKNLYRAGVTGAAMTFTMDDGTTQYDFAIPNVKIPANGIDVGDEGETTMALSGTGQRTTSTAQLTITKS